VTSELVLPQLAATMYWQLYLKIVN